MTGAVPGYAWGSLRCMRWLVSAVFLVPLAASAQWDSQKPAVPAQVSTDRVRLAPGSSSTTAITPRTYQNTGNGLGVLRDMVKGPSPKLGNVIDVEVRRPLAWPKVAKAISRGLPILGTALAVADLLEEVRCRQGASAECDLGVPEETLNGWQAEGCTGTNPVNVAKCAESEPDRIWREGWGTLPAGWYFSEFGGMSCTQQSSDRYFCNGSIIRVHAPGGSVQGQYDYGVQVTASQVEQCPEIMQNGQAYIPVVGRDGKCPTGIYQPADVVDVEARIVEHGNTDRMPSVVPELVQKGFPIEHDSPSVFLPESTVFDARTTVKNPDGSTTVSDRSWSLTPTPEGYFWVPFVVSRTYGVGESIPPAGGLPESGSTVTEGSGASASAEVITCGLPGTPACKIDETGTPTTGNDSAARAEMEVAAAAAIAKINEASSVTLPWIWGFELPTGVCTNWEVPAVGALPGGTIDLCGSWVTQVWRELWAWALGLFACFYAWRRYTDSVGAR